VRCCLLSLVHVIIVTITNDKVTHTTTAKIFSAEGRNALFATLSPPIHTPATNTPAILPVEIVENIFQKLMINTKDGVDTLPAWSDSSALFASIAQTRTVKFPGLTWCHFPVEIQGSVYGVDKSCGVGVYLFREKGVSVKWDAKRNYGVYVDGLFLGVGGFQIAPVDVEKGKFKATAPQWDPSDEDKGPESDTDADGG
jgi:hypothetical protein